MTEDVETVKKTCKFEVLHIFPAQALRDALARVAVEEKWNPGTARDARLTAERLGAAVRKHPGFWARRAAADAMWEQRERRPNLDALAAMRKLIPRTVKTMDHRAVAEFLAKSVGLQPDDERLVPLATRVLSEKILWLVHADPRATAKTHVADLRSRYAYHNLDAVELRAVYASLPTEFENDHDGAKRIWRTEIRRKLADAIDRANSDGGPIGHAAYDVLSKARRAPLKKAQQAPAPAAAKSETAVQGANNGRADPARAPDAAATTTAAAAAQSQSNHLANGAKVPGRTTLPTRQLSSRSLASVDSLDDEDVFAIPWRECYDENYERCYFFNVATGESRWREPDAPYVPYAADPAADATPKRQRNATTATATPAATDDAAATTPKVARRSLSEPPIQQQQQQQQQGDMPPSPIMNAAAPPPPTEATPRTKLSAFLQNHAGAQQQQQ